MRYNDVSIIIPAFNEEKAIKSVINSLQQNFPEAELIVIDDGSTDETAKIVTSTGANFLQHSRNRGYGASLRTGIISANRPYVLFCDADGQHSADDVRRLIDSCNGHDMVVGARDNQSHIPLIRRPGKAILRLFANFLAGEKIPDLNSGLRIIKKDILLRYIHLMPKGFSFSTTSTFALIKSNRNISWIPISTQKRIGTSSVRQLKHGPEALLLILRLTVLFEPLKVFLMCSAGLFISSIFSLFIDLILSDWNGIGDTTVLLIISTLLIFLFGLLCDQVSAIRREIHE